MIRDDTLWKGILEDVCDDFLRFYFEDADSLFDMARGFQFLDKELEQVFPMEYGTAPKFVDKLVKVFTKQGTEEWILVHIEVQGYHDKSFAQRMFTYFYRILDRYGKQVTALAIFTDSNPNFQPNVYEYNYLGTSNTFRFNTYKIITQDAEALAKNDNPFAIVVLTVLLALKEKKLDDETLFSLKLEIFRNLYRRNIDKNKLRGLHTFLNLYVHFAKPETKAKFEDEIDRITKNTNTMGIEEMVLDRAKKEGQKEGQTVVIKNLIIQSNYTDEQIAELAEVTVEFVQRIRRNLKK